MSKPKSAFGIFFYIIAFCMLTACQKETGVGHIKGFVTDLSNNTMQGVVITLSPTGEKAVTNSHGAFEFLYLENGTYTLQCEKEGYERQTKRVGVGIGNTSFVVIQMNYDSNHDALWTERAREITAGCQSDYEKAKAIYQWECANIAYDVDYQIYHADECWELKKGVCQAYSELFVMLASHCGLQAHLASGFCRNSNHLEGDGDHAWVVANTEQGSIIIDPTWGAGYVSGDGFTFYENNMSWFDADPKLAIFTHFPNNTVDQLISPEITFAQYRDLPLIAPVVSQAGWKGQEVLEYFLNHVGEPAPTFYIGFTNHAGLFKLLDVPYAGNMRVGQTYPLKVLSLDEEMAVSSHPNVEWEQTFTEEGVLYQIEFQPDTEGEFYINFGNFNIMKYSIVPQ